MELHLKLTIRVYDMHLSYHSLQDLFRYFLPFPPIAFYFMLKLVFPCLSQAMVARGDLGAELPVEEVPLLQVQ